jgi:hypothetical protein
MMGELGILNVGAGDTKLTFDPNNLADTIRAKRIVKDMLRRGYAIVIEVPPKVEGGAKSWQRVLDFLEDSAEYIIADLDPEIAAAADAQEEQHEEIGSAEAGAPAAVDAEGTEAPTPRKRGRPAGKRKLRSIPAAKTRGTVIARTAGG